MSIRYEKEWKKNISNDSSKLKTYCTFKTNFVIESYITTTTLDKRREFTKLRISAHRLHIEFGRYNKPKIPRELRKLTNETLSYTNKCFELLRGVMCLITT
jgi:hypothetical protein